MKLGAPLNGCPPSLSQSFYSKRTPRLSLSLSLSTPINCIARRHTNHRHHLSARRYFFSSVAAGNSSPNARRRSFGCLSWSSPFMSFNCLMIMSFRFGAVA